MTTDKIYMIKLFKKINIWNTRFKQNETIYTTSYLTELGYKCDSQLCSKYILVYFNKKKNKLIIYFDGIDSVFTEKLKQNDLFKCKEYVDDYTVRVKNTIDVINKKYPEYNKLYLGYCLGGYMINNFVNGKHIVGYTYNSFGLQHNKIEDDIKIINYCEILDIKNMFWRFDTDNKKCKLINSHQKFLTTHITSFLNNFNIATLYYDLDKIMHHMHVIYSVDDLLIEIFF